MNPKKNILWFNDISLADRALVGGKGGSLGELTKALTVKAHKFSKSAEEKIVAAGGKAEVI